MPSPIPFRSSDEPVGIFSSPSLAWGRWRDSAIEGFQSQYQLEQWENDHPGDKHPYSLLMALNLLPAEDDRDDLDEDDVYEVERLLTGISAPSEIPLDDIEQIKRLLKIRAPSAESLFESFEDDSQSKSFEGVEDQKNKAHIEKPKHTLAVRASSVSETETETDYEYDGAGQTADILFGSQINTVEQAAANSKLVSLPVLEQHDLAEEKEVEEQLLTLSSPLSNLNDLGIVKENILTSGSSSALGPAQEVGGGESKGKRNVGTMTSKSDIEGREKKKRKTVIRIEISEGPISVQVFRDLEDDK
ncbi:hypothetical protein Agabi119p4_2693 [Agaricus bisporus var. burnettii]|uniref:Uncharacterized protein n=1 Tax=Agaricus bisporus var. burnettii TaxID=192524 RepID=A0A8H7KKF2_AGABI|nr:hypothetical protein Agabi119p4_2693 [Agaricus bisporus var. burnettii]